MVASCAHAVPAMAQQISDSANDFLQYMLGLLVVDFTSLTSLAVAAPPQQFNLVSFESWIGKNVARNSSPLWDSPLLSFRRPLQVLESALDFAPSSNESPECANTELALSLA
jgi:hypothetical protein